MELINELCQDLALTYGIWLTFDFFYLLTAISHLLARRQDPPVGAFLPYLGCFGPPRDAHYLPHPSADLKSPWGNYSPRHAPVTGTGGVTNFSVPGPGFSFEHLLAQAHARAVHGHACSHCYLPKK